MPTVLICPNCDTRYETAAVIPPEGRKVRCSKCNTVWTVQREGSESAEPNWAPEPQPLPRAMPPMAGPSLQKADAGGGAMGSPARNATPAQPAPARLPVNGGYAANNDEELEFRDRSQDENDSPFSQSDHGYDAPAPSNGRHPLDDADFEMPADEPVHSKPSEIHSREDQRNTPNDAYDPYADTSFDMDDEPPLRPRTGHRDLVSQVEKTAPPQVQMSRVEKPRRRSNASPLVGWLLLLLIVGSVAALAILAPAAVVKALPGAAPFYQAFGVNVNPRGLDFANVAYSIVYDGGGGQLEVSGDITNLTGAEIDTPTLIFSLRNEAGDEVQQYTADVFEQPLAARVTAPFAARMPAPDASVRSVEVRFAPEP